MSKSPDVAGSIRTSLDQPNLKDVSVSQDRDEGLVTLGGHVSNEGDKAQAEALAKSIAVGEVVSNQVASSVPNVRQVVNELQVKNQKATSSN